MKQWISAVIVVICFFSSAINAQEIDKTKPYEMMAQVSEITFARLKSEQSAIKTDPNILKTVVDEELMPYVNVKYAAYKLLGTHLKKTTPEERAEFVTAFRDYLVASYAQVLTLYTDQKIVLEKAKKIPEGKRIISVRVDILDSARPTVKVDFKLRKNKKTGEWQAFDMVAEGVSLLSTKQSEWNGKIRKEGISSVSAELRSLAKQPIRLEGNK
ncbi:phospholipid-binding protein MlaC [Aliivibrio fischeri]|uniref:Phospholipid-binding protein MlaC n=2 Tax=Aliivibrio fischeri TaxID=668 RepID=A0A6N3Z0L2_ALIFS|nr:phospholipid-binding protein MlaC [Aliivibrio fischeri]ACH66751.1 toluene tolerance protein TTG2D [Aliivibrio fischeri MJ11]MCE4937229.1 phospholipid-binding protein MlaC [Aliivibrio fischeri]MUJ27035.1 phospholipid-binding protein MlaC [Aliivibrio fischeri]MUK36827.1 phospholipid-binding protein MlaC [Aliivibrio fischeri]MUK46648.1 phospholipid-binding protein MlaC [Aliivibrio fischeri]